MKIRCENCGVYFDLDQDKTCPRCGSIPSPEHILVQRKDEIEAKKAAYEVERLEAMLAEADLREQRANAEREKVASAQKNREANEKITKGIKIGCLIPVILIALMVIAGVVIGVFQGLRSVQTSEQEKAGTSQPGPIVIEVEESSEEQFVEVSFGERAELSDRAIICEKIENYTYPWGSPKHGFKLIRLYFRIENTSSGDIDQDYSADDLVCLFDYDGAVYEAEHPTIESEYLSEKLSWKRISAGASKGGWAWFEVPEDFDELRIRFGDHVLIHVPGSLNPVAQEEPEE